MSDRTADLAIIGAGPSGTHALLALINKLCSVDSKPTRPLHIAIIERDKQFFSGIAYGQRSGRASLTLSALKRFLPDEERARFVEWLTSNGDAVTGNAGIDVTWVDRHRDDIVAGRWEHLCVPRRLYGEYLADRAHAAIRHARSRGVADFEFVNAVVTAVHESSNRYLVRVSNRDGEVCEIDAAAVVLAIGSPPVRRLHADDGAVGDEFIHDIYDPGLESTVVRLGSRLAALPAAHRNVLVVGGNASALEFLLASHRLIRDLNAHITVLSPTGRPRHWRRKKAEEVAEMPTLAALKARANDGEKVTAVQLYEAVASDMRAAVDSATDVAAVPDIMEAIPFFLGVLDSDDREALASRYGMPISNLLREDCGEAVDILDACVETGLVEFVAGRYRRSLREDCCFQVTATDCNGRDRILDRRYGAIINAIGFEKVSTTRAPLIQQLLCDGIVHASSSDTGLCVDSKFRAAPRLFVVGPLLAGNANEGMVIWHAESVRRIMAIADAVAPCIADELNRQPSGALLATRPSAGEPPPCGKRISCVHAD